MRSQSLTVVPRHATAPTRAGTYTRWDVLLYPATAVMAFFLLWLRRPEALTAARLWAEDGSVFYSAYLVHGPIRSLFEPNNGFLNLIPRLFTALIGRAPAAQIPGLFGAISLLGAALSCGFFALPEYRYFLRSDQVRVACCLAFAAVPYSYDAVGNLAILPWYACIPTMLFLALPRRAYNGRPFWFMLGAASIVFLTALSAPGLVVFIPLACYKIYKGTSRVRIVSGAFLVAMIVQFMVSRVASHANFAAIDLPSLGASMLKVAAYRVMLDNVVGRFASGDLSTGYVVALGALIILAALVAAFVYVETRKEAVIARRLTYIVCAIIASIVITCLGSQLNADPALAAGLDTLQRDHNLLIPIALFYYFLGYACDDLLRWRTAEPFRALAFVVLVTIAAFSNFRLPPLADDDWVSHAPLIDAWRAAQLAGATHSALDLPINPPGWTVSLPALQGAP